MEVKNRTNKLKEKEEMVRPGPDSYRHPLEFKKEANRTNSPAWGFKTSPRSTSASRLNSSPGPGAYNYSPKLGLRNEPRPAIGNAARSSVHLLKMAKLPSPFDYNTSAEYTIKKEPAYSMGKEERPSTTKMARSKSVNALPSPGPADYRIKTVNLPRQPIAAIPNEKRAL